MPIPSVTGTHFFSFFQDTCIFNHSRIEIIEKCAVVNINDIQVQQPRAKLFSPVFGVTTFEIFLQLGHGWKVASLAMHGMQTLALFSFGSIDLPQGFYRPFWRFEPITKRFFSGQPLFNMKKIASIDG
jgi:hypothetical protein